MLIGQYEGKVDSKGRAAFPKKLREELGNKVIITLGYENSLIIVKESNWKTLLSGTEGRPFIESDTRETQRFLLGGASGVELDSKGRFIIPYYLREFGQIKEEIIFLGLNTYVELWDKDKWKIYQKNLEKKIDIISERLAEKEKK